MSLIQPFRALRPAPGRASEVLAPPYDVLTSAEARERAAGKPWSFLHVSKPEIDLDPGLDPHDPAVYAKAADNLQRMIADGVLVRDAKPGYTVYRLTWRDRTQTGLTCVASLADYRAGRIRKHELTTPVKEDDRVRHMAALGAQTGPVMMAYPAAAEIDALIAAAAVGTAHVDVTADGVRHQLWVVDDEATIEVLSRAVDALPALYIGDGHHRSAAAARVAEARAGGPVSSQYFLSVLFPHHEMTILDYNRVLKDLNGMSPAALLARLAEVFLVEPHDHPVRPSGRYEFGMVLAGHWYRLALKSGPAGSRDPIDRLPISLLTQHAIAPLFAVTDPRTDKRIDFVGGGRGLGELERRVKSGEMAVAFALHPTEMADVMAVADAGGTMPPKSTWFEPKLADGMVSHVLD